jgi:hypothetical protein
MHRPGNLCPATGLAAVLKQVRQLIDIIKEHNLGMACDDKEEQEWMNNELGKLLDGFPDHVKSFLVAYGTLEKRHDEMNAAIRALRELEDDNLYHARDEGVGVLEPSSLLASQTQRIVDDVKFLISRFTGPNENASSNDQVKLELSVDKTKEELIELRAQITNLNNELNHERSALKCINEKTHTPIAQSKTRSSKRFRLRIEKIKRKVKSIFNKKTV